MGGLARTIKIRRETVRPVLDERSRRLWAGAEARAIRRGGIAGVAEATWIARPPALRWPRSRRSQRPTLPRLGKVGLHSL